MLSYTNTLLGTNSAISVNEDVKGVVLRGDWDLSMGGSSSVVLPWDVSAENLKDEIESLDEAHTVLVRRERVTKYGEYTWYVTFTKNPCDVCETGFHTPPGAGDMADFDVVSLNSVDVREIQKGSEGLSGAFTIQDATSSGPLWLTFEDSEFHFKAKMQELETVGVVDVERQELGFGWDRNYVSGSGQRGGYRWILRFVHNPGTFGEFTSPPGSGDVDTVTIEDGTLSGNGFAIEIVNAQQGSDEQSGTFRLSLDGSSTSPIEAVDLTDEVVRGALDDIDTVGEVQVSQEDNIFRHVGKISAKMFSPVIVLEDSSASYEMHDLAGMCFGAIENGDGDEASRERTEWNLGLSAQSNGYFPADFYAVNLLECQARCDASAGCVAISYGSGGECFPVYDVYYGVDEDTSSTFTCYRRVLSVERMSSQLTHGDVLRIGGADEGETYLAGTNGDVEVADLSVTKDSAVVSVNSGLQALRKSVLGRKLRIQGDIYEVLEHGMEVQVLSLEALTQIKEGQYSVTFDSSSVCVDWNADADSVKNALETIVGDNVEVERFETENGGEPLPSWVSAQEVVQYVVYFTGSSFVSNLEEMTIDLSQCNDLVDYSDVIVNDADIQVYTNSNGVEDGDLTLATNYVSVTRSSISAYVVAPLYRVVDEEYKIMTFSMKASVQGETLSGQFTLRDVVGGTTTSCLSINSMPWVVESALEDVIVTRSKLDRGGYVFTIYASHDTDISFGSNTLVGDAHVFDGCSSSPLTSSSGGVDLVSENVQDGFDSSDLVVLGNNALTLASVDDSSSIRTWNSLSQDSLNVFAVSGSRFEIDFVTSLGDQSEIQVEDASAVTCSVSVVDDFVAGYAPNLWKIEGLQRGFLYATRVTTNNTLGESPSSNVVDTTIDSVPIFSSEGIKLSYAKHVNEIQRVTVAVTSYDEKQTITTSANYIGEKQIIQTNILQGQTATGTFTVTYGVMETQSMSYDVSAEDLETEIEALDSSIDVSVVRSLSDSRGGFVWTVYFEKPYGNLVEMDMYRRRGLVKCWFLRYPYVR